MFRYLTLIIMIFIIGIFSVNARDLYVDYLDGYLEIQEGSHWNPIDIGDVVSENDIIRLSDTSYAELLFQDIKITLDNDGVYEVLLLLNQIEKVDKWGIKGSSFAKLFREDKIESKQSTVMGVRGDPQDEEDITWVDDDIEFLEEGKSLYQNGDFEDAQVILEEGAEWYGSNYDEILFYKALCEFESGLFREMRESLFEMDPDPASDFFGDYVLLKGNVLIESQDFKKAEELFDSYLTESGLKDAEQMVYLLSAFCSLELDEIVSAKGKLKKSINIDPHSETGRKASDILGSL
jgi:tetratricopeptide (TPR) repeat protein